MECAGKVSYKRLEVRIANQNLENSLSVLSGYLFFDQTIRLKFLVKDDSTIQTFHQEREKGFNIPDHQPSQAYLVTHIFKRVASADLDLRNATLPLDPPNAPKGRKSSQKVTGVGYDSWAVAIMTLIKAYPKHFPDTLRAESHKTGLFASEDVYRAYSLLRASWKILAKKKDSAKRFINVQATTPTFPSDTDVRRYRTKGAEILEAAALKNSMKPAQRAYKVH